MKISTTTTLYLHIPTSVTVTYHNMQMHTCMLEHRLFMQNTQVKIRLQFYQPNIRSSGKTHFKVLKLYLRSFEILLFRGFEPQKILDNIFEREDVDNSNYEQAKSIYVDVSASNNNQAKCNFDVSPLWSVLNLVYMFRFYPACILIHICVIQIQL